MKKLIITALLGLAVAQAYAHPVASEIPNVSKLAAFVSCAPSCDQIIKTVKSTGSSVIASVKNHPLLVAGSVALVISMWGLKRVYLSHMKEVERQMAIMAIWLELTQAGFTEEYVTEFTQFLTNNTQTREEIMNLLHAYLAALDAGAMHEDAMQQAMKGIK